MITFPRWVWKLHRWMQLFLYPKFRRKGKTHMNENQRTQAVQELSSEKTELKREVGLFGGVSVLAGIMIGSGIFYIGGIVLERSGMSLGLALLVWCIGGLVTLMSGICFAELGAMMPKAGGSYVYLREAYGERVAFMSGFSNFILGSSGSNAALAVAFSAAISSLMPLGDLTSKLLATFMIAALTAVNIFGIKLGSRVQNIFMVLKLLPIFVILICGLFMGQQSPDLNPMPASNPGFAEEIKKPKKNLPLAIIISIVGVTILYVLFNYAVYRVLPYDTIASMIASGDYYLGTAAAQTLFGNAGMVIVGVAMILAIFNSLNGCIMVFPRTYYAMARDGAFFKSLAKIHPTYKTPVNALLVSALVSIALVWARDLNQLTSLVAICGIIFNGMTFFAVILLRKKYPTMERPYKVWGYPVMIIVICLVMVGLMINTFIEDPTTALIGLLVPIVGLVLYELVFKKSRQAMLEKEE